MNDRPLYTDPEEPPTGTCGTCGVEIDRDGHGSLRWNGRAWEHKNPDAHPQAGHHVVEHPPACPYDGTHTEDVADGDATRWECPDCGAVVIPGDGDGGEP